MTGMCLWRCHYAIATRRHSCVNKLDEKATVEFQLWPNINNFFTSLGQMSNQILRH